MVSSQHHQRVPGAHSSAHGARQHLVGCAHVSGELDVHVGLVVLQVVEAQVAKVVDGVICRDEKLPSVHHSHRCSAVEGRIDGSVRTGGGRRLETLL